MKISCALLLACVLEVRNSAAEYVPIVPLDDVAQTRGEIVRTAAAFTLFKERDGPDSMTVSAIVNILSAIPPDWDVSVKCCFESAVEAFSNSPVLDRHMHAGRLRVSAFSKANLMALGGCDKNRIFTNPIFWRRFSPAKTILIFDRTTRLCSSSDMRIEDFMEYDYVGAPWSDIPDGNPLVYGGNGALSLRRSRVMAECTEKFGSTYERGNEDMWFSRHLQEMGANVCCRDQNRANHFSVETFRPPAGSRLSPIGVSYSLRTIPKKERDAILQACPEARMLVGYLSYSNWIAKPENCVNPKTEVHFKTKELVPVPPCPWP